MGREREKELELSCKRLGFTEAPTVIDDNDLQDGMDIKWAPELVADYVTKWCKSKESIDGSEGKIDMIITFDEGGVSGHTNHNAVYEGVKILMEKKMIDVEVMALTTVPLIRKYLGAIDVNFVWMDEWQAFRFDWITAYRTLALHETQMVWFRKIFIVISRYTYINSF